MARFAALAALVALPTFVLLNVFRPSMKSSDRAADGNRGIPGRGARLGLLAIQPLARASRTFSCSRSRLGAYLARSSAMARSRMLARSLRQPQPEVALRFPEAANRP